jgi:hypothetical protein
VNSASTTSKSSLFLIALLISNMMLFVLRLMIYLFVPEASIWIRVFGNEIVFSRELVTLALWCIWLPLLAVSIFALYQQKHILGTSGVGHQDESALQPPQSL